MSINRFFQNVMALVLIVLMGAISQATAATITVTSSNDSGAGTLRQAVADAASSGDIIDMSGVAGASITLDAELVINKSVTILGQNCVVQASATKNDLGIDYRVMLVADSVVVKITDLTIRHGRYISSTGGGIYNRGHLTLVRCTIADNTAGSRGGGIDSYAAVSGSLAMYNCTIYGNTATQGGGLNIYSGNVNVVNCAFSNNSASSTYGGGIYINSDALTVKGSTFEGNTAGQHGGGLYVFGGSATVRASTFTGNGCVTNGGAVFKDTAGALSLIGVTIADNSAGFDGGGIAFEGAILLKDSIVATNTSVEGQSNNVTSDLHPAWGNVFDAKCSYNLIGVYNANVSGLYAQPGTLYGTTGTPLNPQLSEISNNGGATRTHALSSTSPALSKGNPQGHALFDQRGAPRKTIPDIGAFESINLGGGQGYGGGAFVAHATAPTPSSAVTETTAMADIDGDGDLDVLAGTSGGVLVLQNSAGVLTAGATVGSGSIPAIALGDIDGDGDIDLLAGTSAGIAVWVNNGSGAFSAHATTPTVGSSAVPALAVADLNADGNLDVVAGSSASGCSVWLNDGTGAFSAHPTVPTFGSGAVTAIDINEFTYDNHMDAAVGGTSALTLWVNDGTGAFTAHSTHPSFAYISVNDVRIMNFDDDAYMDFVVATGAGIELLRNVGSMTINAFATVGSGSVFTSLVVGDADSDGDEDLIGGTTAGAIVYLNNGSGTFTAQPVGATFGTGYINTVSMGDLDGDLDTDVVSGSDSGLSAWVSTHPVPLSAVTQWNGATIEVTFDMPMGDVTNAYGSLNLNDEGDNGIAGATIKDGENTVVIMTTYDPVNVSASAITVDFDGGNSMLATTGAKVKPFTGLAVTVLPPPAPVVTGPTTSTNLRPTWTWTSAGGEGLYRYKLDDSDLTVGAMGTSGTSFTPTADLTVGTHTLYVQEAMTVEVGEMMARRTNLRRGARLAGFDFGGVIVTAWSSVGSHSITIPASSTSTGPVLSVLVEGSTAAPATLSFKAQCSDSIQSTEWDFDGDGIYDLSVDATSANHLYRLAGTYTVQVRATLSSGSVITTTREVTIDPLRLFVDENGTLNLDGIGEELDLTVNLEATPAEGDAPLDVTFTGSLASTTAAYVTQYEWTLEEGASLQVTTAPTLSHTYEAGGTHTVRLVLAFPLDAALLVTTEVKVNLLGDYPQVDLVYPDSAIKAKAPLTLDFALQPKEGVVGNVGLRYAWQFGDAWIPGYELRTQEPQMRHTYDIVGSYVPRVRVTNALGLSVTLTLRKGVAVEESDTPIVRLLSPAANTTVHGPILPVAARLITDEVVYKTWFQIRAAGASAWTDLPDVTYATGNIYRAELDLSAYAAGAYELRFICNTFRHTGVASLAVPVVLQAEEGAIITTSADEQAIVVSSQLQTGVAQELFAPGIRLGLPLDTTTNGAHLSVTTPVGDLGGSLPFTLDASGVSAQSLWKLELLYVDGDQDGTEDRLGVPVRLLQVYYRNEAQAWRALPVSVANPQTRTLQLYAPGAGDYVLREGSPLNPELSQESIAISADAEVYAHGDSQTLHLNTIQQGVVDVYVGLLTPENEMFFLKADGTLGATFEAAAFLSGWESQLLQQRPVATIPIREEFTVGLYTWFMAITEPGADPYDSESWKSLNTFTWYLVRTVSAELVLAQSSFTGGDIQELLLAMPAMGVVDMYIWLETPWDAKYYLSGFSRFAPSGEVVPLLAGWDSLWVADFPIFRLQMPRGMPTGDYHWRMQIFQTGTTETPLADVDVPWSFR